MAQRRHFVQTGPNKWSIMDGYAKLSHIPVPFPVPVPHYGFYVIYRRCPDYDSWDLCRNGVALISCHSFRGISTAFHILVSCITMFGLKDISNLYRCVMEACVRRAGWSSVKPLYSVACYNVPAIVPDLSDTGIHAWRCGLTDLRLRKRDVPWLGPYAPLNFSCAGADVHSSNMCSTIHGDSVLKMHPFVLDRSKLPFCIL